MSAFVVDDKTINRFLTWLFYNCDKVHYLKNEFEHAGYDLNRTETFCRIGKDMKKMNIDAVNYRYEDHTKDDENFVFADEPVKIEQALKSLRCFLYQCNEGSIPKRKLYGLLESAKKTIQELIIESLEDYKNAEWG